MGGIGANIVEVYSLTAAGGWRCGSGHHLGGGLVLTASHVVCDAGGPATHVRVRFPGEPMLVEARMVWRPADPLLDVAVVEAGVQPATCSARQVRWGVLVGDSPGIPCQAAGFPDVLKRLHDGVRDLEQLHGTISPLTGAISGLHSVSVADPPMRVTGSGSPWAGMSGAALFCGELLTGVIVADAAGFASHRLTALPVARFATDPEFAALIRAATGNVPVLEAVELQGLFERPPHPHSPAALLRADVASVRFRGRRDTIGHLADWCRSANGFAAKVVVGPGGQGKTRMASELCRLMADEGWVAGIATEIQPEAAIKSLHAVVRPVLLVVDYAESRGDLVHALTAGLAAAGVQARLLLLARSIKEWLVDLAARSEQLSSLARPEVLELGPIDTEAAGRRQSWHEAVADLARGLAHVGGHADVDWSGLANELEPPSGLDGPRYGNVLALHVDALSSLLQAGHPVDTPPAGNEDLLLLHEFRYWTHTARAAGLNLTALTCRRIVVAATIWSAADRAEALSVLAHLPGLRGLDEDRYLAVAEWLAGLYPIPGRYWGMLQPDRLGEHLAATLLTDESHWDLLTAVAPHASAGQLHHVLTTLTRTLSHRRKISPTIAHVINSNPVAAIPVAAAVSRETENSEVLLAAMAASVPDHIQLFLGRASADRSGSDIFQDLVDQFLLLDPDRDAALAKGAQIVAFTSIQLMHLGKHQMGALFAAIAVVIFQRVPDEHFVPHGPMTYAALAKHLVDLGEGDGALTVIEECVIRCRRLTQRPEIAPDILAVLSSVDAVLPPDPVDPQEFLTYQASVRRRVDDVLSGVVERARDNRF